MSKQNLKEELHPPTQEHLKKKEDLIKAQESFEKVKNWLEAIYPKAFNFQNPIPLKRGIWHELLAKDSPFSEAQLHNALKGYVRSDPYLKSIIQQQWRHDLNGEQTEEILEGEREYSKQFLFFRKEKKAAKKTQVSLRSDGVRDSKDDSKKKK